MAAQRPTSPGKRLLHMKSTVPSHQRTRNQEPKEHRELEAMTRKMRLMEVGQRGADEAARGLRGFDRRSQMNGNKPGSSDQDPPSLLAQLLGDAYLAHKTDSASVKV